ncbi:Lipocalin-like domain-containing protein [Capnocytophaga haemolytica]|uniref:Planctomycetes uncharacterized domain n=1 Tax=Capnocytophaga haemolytica TaxID=45243 RepID=A0AAX2GYV1_9FLAO|nr:lipocalin family protein [Capnocytophaga haemolytica]AMD84228.1 hypothetical protein AXF12_00960 [Capnocytophaga haemolytica]SFN95054.1 Lipocalin-like domain-containing protein [Capnocytophaga haemolytica]SNV12489.1 Planctomycetes uncharacterized domain [Capnocytophaga haemolytica]
MKNVAFLKSALMAVSILFFAASCSKDKEESKEDLIQGTWFLTSNGGAPVDNDLSPKIVFANNKVTITSVYKNEQDKIVEESEEGTFRIEGNTLILISSKMVEGRTEIVSLTSSEMVLKTKRGIDVYRRTKIAYEEVHATQKSLQGTWNLNTYNGTSVTDEQMKKSNLVIADDNFTLTTYEDGKEKVVKGTFVIEKGNRIIVTESAQKTARYQVVILEKDKLSIKLMSEDDVLGFVKK